MKRVIQSDSKKSVNPMQGGGFVMPHGKMGSMPKMSVKDFQAQNNPGTLSESGPGCFEFPNRGSSNPNPAKPGANPTGKPTGVDKTPVEQAQRR